MAKLQHRPRSADLVDEVQGIEAVFPVCLNLLRYLSALGDIHVAKEVLSIGTQSNLDSSRKRLLRFYASWDSSAS